MNWQAVAFDWNQVRAFLATAEEGSFSAAARALGLTQPTLGRQVAGLEAALDVTLFERGTRGLVLTPTGQDLLTHVREMSEAAARVSLAASGRAETIEGDVRVSASEMHATYILPTVVADLRRDHPGIRVEIVANNALSDLRHREADIAIRNTRPQDPELIAKLVKEQDAGLFAHESLLADLPPIRTPADLKDAPLIGFGHSGQHLDGLRKRELPVTEDNFVAGSENHLVHWQLALCGVGIAVNTEEVAQRFPGMVRVLPDAVRFTFPVWLVAPKELQASRRMRIVFDTLAAALAEPRRRSLNPLDGREGRA